MRKQTNRRRRSENENACQLLFVGPDPSLLPSLSSICEKFLTSSIFTAPFSPPLQPHRKTGALPAGIRWYLSPDAPLLTLQLRKPTRPISQRTRDGWMDADDGDSLTGSPCLSRSVSPLSKAPSSAREGEKNVSQADKRTNNVLRSDDAKSGGGLN